MDKNYSMDEIKHLLLDQQFNNTEEECSKEKCLELIPSLLTIMKENNSEFFHLAMKQLYSTCFTYISSDDWEQLVFKDSFSTVSIYLSKLISQLDIQIDQLMQDLSALDLVTGNILNLIQSCDNALGPINSLLVSMLCQHQLIGSKMPSILLCIPDIMLLVWNHCAVNKIKYESHCNEAVTKMVKKLYSNNKLIQTSYFTLLEDKIDFSDSQETEFLEESLVKLGKLGAVLLQLDVFSAYSAFKTYCSLAIRYAGNLRNTLYLTPTVHAMAQQVALYVAEFREPTTTQADPLQARKTKLFRVFIKLILDLVETYRGSLRDTHTSLVSLLATMYDFTCDSSQSDTSTLVEAAANNLVTCCYQDPYFLCQLYRTESSTRGFIKLCVVVMKKILEDLSKDISADDISPDDKKLEVIQTVFRSMSSMDEKSFRGIIASDQYKLTVSTLSVLCLTLTPAEYCQLERSLFQIVLSSKLVSLFACDVWCILLNSGPKSLFDATCVFLVQYLNDWNPAGYNFSYLTLNMLVRRCLRSIKPSCVKKLFASGCLSYTKYPVLMSITLEYLNPSSTIASSIPSSLHPYQVPHSLLLRSSLDATAVLNTVQSLHWGDPSTEYCVDVLCASLEGSVVAYDKHALTDLFKCIANILSFSSNSYTWLCMLRLLSRIPMAGIELDREITELLFSTILNRISENPEDCLNPEITTFSAVMAKFDKSAFLRVLKRLGKLDLVAKYSVQFSKYDDYDYLNQIGVNFQMKCICNTDQSKEDVEMKSAEDVKTNSPSCSSLSSPEHYNKDTTSDVNENKSDAHPVPSNDKLNVHPVCSDLRTLVPNLDGKSTSTDVTTTNELLASIDINNSKLSSETVSNQSKKIKLEENVQINMEVEERLSTATNKLKEIETCLREKQYVLNSTNRGKLEELICLAKSLY